jgi:hypothetical protein
VKRAWWDAGYLSPVEKIDRLPFFAFYNERDMIFEAMTPVQT